MVNDFKIIRKDENSELLVITPLLPKHKISKITKKTIKRNGTKLTWITSCGRNNIPKNVEYGLEWYVSKYKIPKYILPLDRDIELGRYMIDRLVKKLKTQPHQIAFAYAGFEFRGSINKKFPAKTYNINKLVKDNYISSNSLMRYDALKNVGGMVIDDEMVRLLDWALWLKFFYHGYIGINVPEASFIAYSTPDDISAGTLLDYQIKKNRVIKNYIEPIFEKYKS